jgi:hypothetical protein
MRIQNNPVIPAKAGIQFSSDTQAASGSPLQSAAELASSARFAGVTHAPRSPFDTLRGNDGYLFFKIGFMQSLWRCGQGRDAFLKQSSNSSQTSVNLTSACRPD